MRQLAQFATEKNKAWFESPEAYWFSKVFKKMKTTEPNQALEPTTMAVTFRAPSRTKRASHGRGSS